MSASLEEKMAAVDHALDSMRVAGDTGPHFEAMKAIAIDLRAEGPKEISKTLRAMTHQVRAALRGKAQLGFFDHGAMQTITEGLCGRWWPVIERALQHYEKEKASA
jgi:hypothetical protein